MNASGTKLMLLKHDHQKAVSEYAATLYKRSRLGMWIGFISVLPIAFTFQFAIWFEVIPNQHLYAYAIGLPLSVAMTGAAAYLLFGKGKLTALKAAEETAGKAYRDALLAELTEYGVDTSSIQEHTDAFAEPVIISAYRKNVLSEIFIRERANGLVFLLDGKEMNKLSAA